MTVPITRSTVARLKERGLDDGWLRDIAIAPKSMRGSGMSRAAIHALSYHEALKAVGRVPDRDYATLWGPGKFYDTLMKLLEARP